MATKNDTYQDQLIEKIQENYLSIALGLLVLLVAVSIVFRANDSMVEKKAAEEAEKENIQANREHVVQQGESVSSIARDQLGSMDLSDEIVEANKLENPEQIEVGQKLVLPDVGQDKAADEKGEVAGEETEEETKEAMTGDLNGDGVTTTMPGGAITGDTYTVQKGDTLFNITVQAYNDSSMMRNVMRANGLWNANHIQAGMTLKLPR